MFDRAASEGLTIGGVHFNMPGFMMIERRGQGDAEVVLPWLPALE